MIRFVGVSIVLLCATMIGTASCAENQPFVVDTLLDGVWLFRAPGHPASHTNSLVIEREAGLLVVESQPSPEAARQLLRAIAAVSTKPVQYLLFTHAHAESTGGASAFPESALVIASALTHDALADETRDLSGETRLRATDPDAWTAPPRVLPDMLISSGTRLVDGKHIVELLPLAGGHYPGFVIVRIEAEGFYYVGSMVSTDRNPFADVEHSSIRAWVNSLNSLSLRRPETIVPLRGEAIDADTLRWFRDSLVWVVGQVENAFIEGIDTDEVLSFAMDSPNLGEYFNLEADPSFVTTLFETARGEAVAQRRKRRVP
ncbi:MAG: MBL fold metallo-hydrolase [Acidobacteria bacterium]|nr:MBL fold metallo-hydrolase [Acidobacteriota bacterium]